MKIGKSICHHIDVSIFKLCWDKGFLYIEFYLLGRLIVRHNELYRVTRENLFILVDNENW